MSQTRHFLLILQPRHPWKRSVLCNGNGLTCETNVQVDGDDLSNFVASNSLPQILESSLKFQREISLILGWIRQSVHIESISSYLRFVHVSDRIWSNKAAVQVQWNKGFTVQWQISLMLGWICQSVHYLPIWDLCMWQKLLGCGVTMGHFKF